MTGYPSTAEHLDDALTWVGHLVRAHLCRRQAAITFEGQGVEDRPGEIGNGEIGAFLTGKAGTPTGNDAWLSAADEWFQAAEQALETLQSRQHETVGARSRLTQLSERLDLSDAALEVVYLCLWSEAASENRRTLALLAGDLSRKVPDVALVRSLLGRGVDELLAPYQPLINHRVVRLVPDSPSIDVMSAMSVVLDPRISAFVSEIDYIPEQLSNVVTVLDPLNPEDLLLPTTRRDGVVERARTAANGGPLLVTLQGAPGSGRTAVARTFAGFGGYPLLRADLSTPSTAHSELFAAIYREARIRRAGVLWTGCAAIASRDAASDDAWNDLLARAAGYSGVSFLDHAQPWDHPAGGSGVRRVLIELPPLTTDERAEVWTIALDPRGQFADDVNPRELAESFRLTPGRIRDAVFVARAAASERRPGALVTGKDLAEASRRQSQRRLMSLARRVDPPSGLTLDDLVLPDDHKQQLNLLRARILYRERVEERLGESRSGPRGLVAMFSGSSGTGKTFAAGLLADDLGRDLLKVDLSQVISKWVGETEKHLDRLFNEAHDAHAILFFDEADALFGKRGEVTNAQDRYAAQEVGFLLQRIEEFDGVVILATNLRQNLDPAFLRRIQVIVEFPLPDESARFTIWKRQLAAVGLELADEQIVGMARPYRLSAAAIAQIVSSALYLADLSTKDLPKIDHLAEALRLELLRLGLPGL